MAVWNSTNYAIWFRPFSKVWSIIVTFPNIWQHNVYHHSQWCKLCWVCLQNMAHNAAPPPPVAQQTQTAVANSTNSKLSHFIIKITAITGVVATATVILFLCQHIKEKVQHIQRTEESIIDRIITKVCQVSDYLKFIFCKKISIFSYPSVKESV